jgi:hypothetical protein
MRMMPTGCGLVVYSSKGNRTFVLFRQTCEGKQLGFFLSDEVKERPPDRFVGLCRQSFAIMLDIEACNDKVQRGCDI